MTASPRRRHDGRNRAILAIDTATSRVVVAVGTVDGEPLGLSTWPPEHRHGEQLLQSIERVLGEANIRRSRLEAIVGDPPRLVYDPEGVETARPRRDTVHVRSGPLAGQAGRWDGLAGLRRFAGGTYLEAGFVRFGDDPPIAIALGDLERIE